MSSKNKKIVIKEQYQESMYSSQTNGKTEFRKVVLFPNLRININAISNKEHTIFQVRLSFDYFIDSKQKTNNFYLEMNYEETLEMLMWNKPRDFLHFIQNNPSSLQKQSSKTIENIHSLNHYIHNNNDMNDTNLNDSDSDSDMNDSDSDSDMNDSDSDANDSDSDMNDSDSDMNDSDMNDTNDINMNESDMNDSDMNEKNNKKIKKRKSPKKSKDKKSKDKKKRKVITKTKNKVMKKGRSSLIHHKSKKPMVK
jgi:hypothetical protein